MTKEVPMSSLSPARRRLVALMQQINFGRIEDLLVRSGEPVLSPQPRVVREIKFSADNAPRPEAAIGRFVLKRQVVEMLEGLSELGDGRVEVLEVKHGLPYRMNVEAHAVTGGAA